MQVLCLIFCLRDCERAANIMLTSFRTVVCYHEVMCEYLFHSEKILPGHNDHARRLELHTA